MQRINPSTLARWKHVIELYKREVRPWLPTCRVYHHTPIQDYQRQGNWVVLEYVSSDRARGVAGIFRLAGNESDTYPFVARGLDISREYAVTFDNSGQTSKISGLQLCTTGLPIRVPAPLMSELLIIQGD